MQLRARFKLQEFQWTTISESLCFNHFNERWKNQFFQAAPWKCPLLNLPQARASFKNQDLCDSNRTFIFSEIYIADWIIYESCWISFISPIWETSFCHSITFDSVLTKLKRTIWHSVRVESTPWFSSLLYRFIFSSKNSKWNKNQIQVRPMSLTWSIRNNNDKRIVVMYEIVCRWNLWSLMI